MNIVSITLRNPASPALLFFLAAIAIHDATANADYTYTTIATSNAVGGSGLSIPSISRSGTVAFIDSASNPSVLDALASGSLAPIVSSSNSLLGYGDGNNAVAIIGAPDINDVGTVAYWAHATGTTYNLVEGTSGGFSTLATQERPIGSASNVSYASPEISDSGAVVFAQYHQNASPPTGIYLSSGGGLTTIATSNSLTGLNTEPAISHNGIVTYAWPGAAGIGENLFIYANGISTQIATTSNQALSATYYDSLAINNAGTVAALTNNGAIELAAGQSATSIATLGNVFTSFGQISINDAGTIAFSAAMPGQSFGTTIQGIYTGADPVQDKIIATGDALDGSLVTAIAFGRDSLSDTGQIAFWAALQNGEQGVFIATPVPEPSAGILAILSAGMLLLRLRRRASIV